MEGASFVSTIHWQVFERKLVVKNGKEAIFYGLSALPLSLHSSLRSERLRRGSNPCRRLSANKGSFRTGLLHTLVALRQAQEPALETTIGRVIFSVKEKMPSSTDSGSEHGKTAVIFHSLWSA